MEQKNNNKILIHACCGICSAYPIQFLKEAGYTPVVYFCNPNLDSEDEFKRRLEAQRTVCQYHNVDLLVEEYNPQEFSDYVKGFETEPEKGKRCDKCIELRLKKTGEKAKELGINLFTTSLPISPHKDFEKISVTGQTIAEQSGLNYAALNFKKKDGFLKTNKLSKELNIYRQNYCGCVFSKR